MYIERKSLTVSFVEWNFAMLSIFLNKNYEKYENIYRWSFFAFVGVPTLTIDIYFCLTLESFIDLSDVAVFGVSTLSINLVLLTIHYRRHSFIKIYKAITASHFVDEEFIKISDKLLKRMLLRFGSSVTLCLTLLIVFPVLIASCTDAKYGTFPTLLYPLIYPWEVNSAPMYVVTLCFQMVCCIVPLMTVAGVILFILAMRILLSCCLLRMQKDIRDIDSMNGDSMSEVSNLMLQKTGRVTFLSTDDEVLWKLHRIIKHHQFLVRFVTDVIHASEPCVVIGGIQFMAENLGVIPIILMSDGDQLHRLKLTNMLIISDTFFFLCCYMGEWLNHLVRNYIGNGAPH